MRRRLITTTTHRIVISEKPWPSLQEWRDIFENLDPRIPPTARVRYGGAGPAWAIEWASEEVAK